MEEEEMRSRSDWMQTPASPAQEALSAGKGLCVHAVAVGIRIPALRFRRELVLRVRSSSRFNLLVVVVVVIRGARELEYAICRTVGGLGHLVEEETEKQKWKFVGARLEGDLAAEGTKTEGVNQAAVTDLAGPGDALAGPRLRALVQEDDAGAVDDVGLHAADVQHLLDLRHPDHVVAKRKRRWSIDLYLDGVVVAVSEYADGAKSAVRAIEAVHVALAPVGMNRVLLALHEEASRQQRPQPRRPPVLLPPTASLHLNHPEKRRGVDWEGEQQCQNWTPPPLDFSSKLLSAKYKQTLMAWPCGALGLRLINLSPLNKKHVPQHHQVPVHFPLFDRFVIHPNAQINAVGALTMNSKCCGLGHVENVVSFRSASFTCLLEIEMEGRPMSLDILSEYLGFSGCYRDDHQIPESDREPSVPEPLSVFLVVSLSLSISEALIDPAMGGDGMVDGHFVFTYGTLKRGFSNHGLIQELVRAGDASFVGDARTTCRLPLVCGPYRVPFLLNLPGAGERVAGEIYAVSPRGLARMDELEGTRRGHYERLPISVVLLGDPGSQLVEVAAEAYYANPSYAGELWRRNGERGYSVYSEREATGYVKRKDRPQDITFLEQIRLFVASLQS
ncbi:hypothetical protein ZIOFF_033081 [Zingiber officinale]|uniref:Gamma-glutamylcyclotransferase AIG2-like domain-containing protein n=2 Tax=Zingiber officinale TaxID=94328 RepID=A0A8J5GNM6_ZINOF|nr:hypothetical protein ZIOFF_033081 [Zingiber officinale]